MSWKSLQCKCRDTGVITQRVQTILGTKKTPHTTTNTFIYVIYGEVLCLVNTYCRYYESNAATFIQEKSIRY